MTFRMHHIGRVVSSILEQYTYYAQLGFSTAEGFATPIADTEQQVTVGVVEAGGMLIELLEPLSDESPVAAFLKKGGGLHHVCYEVDNFDSAITNIKNARQITKPTYSVWNNRRVVFFLSRDGDIFELLEGAL